MAERAADLRVAAAAVDARHQPGERLGLADPARGAAFAEPAEIQELHVEPADRGGGLEHLRLNAAGEVPHRLPAQRGVEREDEPATVRARRDGGPAPSRRRGTTRSPSRRTSSAAPSSRPSPGTARSRTGPRSSSLALIAALPAGSSYDLASEAPDAIAAGAAGRGFMPGRPLPAGARARPRRSPA